jgi:putative ABC transport system substrate-binding protein
LKIKWFFFFLTIVTFSVVLYNYIEKDDNPPLKVGVIMIGESRYEKFLGLKQGLLDLGYKENEFEFVLKNGKDDDRLLENQIARLLKETPDVIVAMGGIETLELKKQVTDQQLDIPIVFAGIAAPKDIGVIDEYHTPGGQFTGVNNYHTGISGKRLEMLYDLIPSLKRVHVLYDQDIEVSQLSLENTKEAAMKLAIEIVVHPVGGADFLEQFGNSIQNQEGILVLPGFRMESMAEQIVEISRRYQAPTMGIYEHETESGFLASYGATFYSQGYQAARYVSLIIQGNSPSELPVELPDSIQFFINKQVAKELNIPMDHDLIKVANLVMAVEGNKADEAAN